MKLEIDSTQELDILREALEGLLYNFGPDMEPDEISALEALINKADLV